MKTNLVGSDVVIGDSWTHRLARPLVRPLVETGITPNHITTARLVIGLMACCALVPGDPVWTWWAGWMWLLSAFLDRADGELARVGNMGSPEGQAWDYQVDLIVNPAFFAAIGIGLCHSVLGVAAIPLGLVAGGSVFLGAYWSKALGVGRDWPSRPIPARSGSISTISCTCSRRWPGWAGWRRSWWALRSAVR
jgi:hypothetical protein